MIITSSNWMNISDSFEVVEKMPSTYFVWNIGENMGHDDMIPICQDLHPEDKNNFEINRNTLKAIRLDPSEVQKLRKAASCGVVSKATAEKALRSKRTSYNAKRKKAHAEATIDIFHRISEVTA